MATSRAVAAVTLPTDVWIDVGAITNTQKNVSCRFQANAMVRPPRYAAFARRTSGAIPPLRTTRDIQATHARLWTLVGAGSRRRFEPECRKGPIKLRHFGRLLVWPRSRDKLCGELGGERGIRTLETVSRLHAFQACAFDHSATSPAKMGEYTQASAGRKRMRTQNSDWCLRLFKCGRVPNSSEPAGVPI